MQPVEHGHRSFLLSAIHTRIPEPPQTGKAIRGDAQNHIAPLLLFPVYERLSPHMRKPSLGEYNLGALAGAVVGSIGGLFAVGLPPAVHARNPALLFGTPMLGMLSWLLSGLLGWFLGGQAGPRLGEKYRSQQAELFGGGLAGLVPVVSITLWSWYMVTH
jgi:hypothetical protein